MIFHLFGTPGAFADFLLGKWAKMQYLTNYWAVLLDFCCSDIYLSKEHIDTKMAQFGVLDGEI